MATTSSGTARVTLPAEGQILIEREFAAPARLERDGVTLLRTLVEHKTPEARDMHINSGMESGMQDAFDRLEQVAASLA